MIERKERKPYWLHTKWQMLASLAPLLAVAIVVPLYAGQLNTARFLGIPLGFFVACHGVLFICFAIAASFVRSQDAIDHWHGAHEDS